MSKETSSSAGIAVVANKIIEGSHKLTPNQMKLVYLGISKIDSKHDKSLRTFKIHVSEFASLLGRERDGSLYPEVRRMGDSLMKQVISIEKIDTQSGKREFDLFQWVSRCKYSEASGQIEITFHEQIAPFLLELKKSFTQLRINRIAEFRSSYTIRFYERISMLNGLKQETWTMSEAELRKWLAIDPDAYKAFSFLRRSVIETAKRELDESSDFTFTYDFKKKHIDGKKQAVITFTIMSCGSADTLFPEAKPVDYGIAACLDRLKAATKETKESIARLCREKIPETKDMETAALIGGLSWGQKDLLPDLFKEFDGKRTVEA